MEDNWETSCPSSDDDMHCVCWYDGEECCFCHDPADPDRDLEE